MFDTILAEAKRYDPDGIFVSPIIAQVERLRGLVGRPKGAGGLAAKGCSGCGDQNVLRVRRPKPPQGKSTLVSSEERAFSKGTLPSSSGEGRTGPIGAGAPTAKAGDVCLLRGRASALESPEGRSQWAPPEG